MCGLAGYLRFAESDSAAKQLAQQMGEAIWHRGPDAGSSWHDEKIMLVHRQLSDQENYKSRH